MFNGTPVIEQVSSRVLRITGSPDQAVTLSPNASATLGFSVAEGALPDLVFPEGFAAPSASFGGVQVSLAALVKVDVSPISVGPRTNLPPTVEKFGTTAQDFRVRITNTKTDEVTQALEIYVSLLGGEGDPRPGVVVEVVDSPDARVTVDVG